MPFWKKKVDPEEEAARAEAEATLPPGWSIHRADLETFRASQGYVTTYGICAAGPDGSALVIAVGKANAYHQFARFMHKELDVAEGWAVPVPATEGREWPVSFSLRHEDDPEVVSAKEELDEALPPGWEVLDSDRERYFFPGGYVETWAVTARGPNNETELVMGLGEAGGLRQLAKRLRGELEVTEAWAVPMEYFTQR